jgi:proline iminopeptidase
MGVTETSRGTVRAGDTELAYVVVGEGEPLVAIHGGPGFGHAHLRPGLDLLANGRRVVYYDLRGSGDSPPGDAGKISIAGSFTDLDALLDGLAIEAASLIGHSATAYVAMLYAVARPDRVRSLVLLHPGPPLPPELRERFGTEMAARRPPEAVEEMGRLEGSPEFEQRDIPTLERYYQLRYIPFFSTPESAYQAQFGFTRITADNVVEGGRLLRDFGDHDPAGSLRRVRCPALVVHAENDPIPLESSRFVADSIPGAVLVVLEGGSHFSFIERPYALAEAVEPFLAEHAS